MVHGDHCWGYKTGALLTIPESKVHVANMGPIWGRQDPGGPHVGPINFAIWVVRSVQLILSAVPNLQESWCYLI